jgi:glycosyltransferase involved in cell wall biosynthesis
VHCNPAVSADLRVLVDVTAVPTDRGGVGRYVDSLLRVLEERDVDLVVGARATDEEHYTKLCPSTRVIPAPTAVGSRPVRLVWEQVGLPRVIDAERPDVVHSPHYTRPLATKRPVVVSLHDATFFTHPERHQVVKRTFFRSWSRSSLRRAARCIVPSASTRDELVRATGVAPQRMDVVHHGVDRKVFFPPDQRQQEQVREQLGLANRRYVAFLGTLEPRKNLPNLVRGFARAGLGDDVVLVLAGGSGWDDDLDGAVTEAKEMRVDVLRPGFLPQEALSGYLGGADVVAYPSHGEGFGLPVLEAMACGAAVLTTPHLALPEVGGDAVAYTETGPDEIAQALHDLLRDDDRRTELGDRGLRRAAGFTWSAAADAHLDVYRRAARLGP